MHKIGLDELPIVLPEHIDQESVKLNTVFSPKTKMFATYDEVNLTGLICYEGSQFWTMLHPIKNKDFAVFVSNTNQEHLIELRRKEKKIVNAAPFLN